MRNYVEEQVVGYINNKQRTVVAKKKKKRNNLEEQLCCTLNDYLKLQYMPNVKFWTHLNSGEHAGGDAAARARAGARAKRMGAKKGVLDFVFGFKPFGSGGTTGWLEIKIPPNGLTPEQEKFMQDCDDLGLPNGVARTFDEAIDLLKEWGAI